MEGIVLTPAYGRDYKSKAEVLKAWEDGKDFYGHSLKYGNAYVNIHDLPRDIEQIEFRYFNGGRIVCVEV